ncbi:helix-turn-helix transcriptional regulator [Candidatus Dojkabacteria bacterium]|uniref:Helix-turn-helix transcriptional regulator n=1 Tax=Candidatus Dojkabacteria bacterium TaxID=2099670 RepID=A0A955L1V9_9BACT|nr:helix-turn-helix transcriptional regulator [Candidatus Dojkabacteria bacterium]
MKKTIYKPKYESVVRKLKEARLQSGMKQEAVADALGKYQSYVSKVESGDRRIDVIELLEFARLYKKNIQFFLEEAT